MKNNNSDQSGDCCHSGHNHGKRDWLFLITGTLIIIGYAIHLSGLSISGATSVSDMSQAVYDIMNKMAWGLVLAIIFVGLLSKIPKSLVQSALGKGDSFLGLVRATFAGLVLDLCSHGILLVGMQLYRQGASLGQTMAFLIASPWNSLSMTIILISLIGLKWTLIFIALSLIIALLTGIIFNTLVKRGVLPSNQNELDSSDVKSFRQELKSSIKGASVNRSTLTEMFKSGFSESKMLLRWVFLGVVLAAALRTFVSTDLFQHFFGPDIVGIGLTLVAATIIEVCSEGSAPIAADILNRAGAPGNAFTFLMAGAATDYTEIIGLKETTGSWKISLFLPLVTVPQILILGYIINTSGAF